MWSHAHAALMGLGERRALTGASAVGAVTAVPVRGLAEMLPALPLLPPSPKRPEADPKRLDAKLLASCPCLMTWSLISICSGAAACSTSVAYSADAYANSYPSTGHHRESRSQYAGAAPLVSHACQQSCSQPITGAPQLKRMLLLRVLLTYCGCTHSTQTHMVSYAFGPCWSGAVRCTLNGLVRSDVSIQVG